MKIDRSRPSHWLLLTVLFIQGLLGLVYRLVRGPEQGVVILYGHKLNGNLLALYRGMRHTHSSDFTPYFLTMDEYYHKSLIAQGVPSVWVGNFRCAQLLGKAGAIVSDHGLHSLGLLRAAYKRVGTRFVDVWHAIPFKGFDAEDFMLQHRYDEVWVASDFCRDMYVTKYGFRSEMVRVTGYARTDFLTRCSGGVTGLRRRLGLPTDGKVVLYAPTWEQDDNGRSVYPFGCSEEEFLTRLSEVAKACGAIIILRNHLNTGAAPVTVPEGLHVLSMAEFPDTESVLRMTDVLICDWSSIAFDFLLLDRPAIFVDVPPPFKKGFSVGPEYRYGEIVVGRDELFQQLAICLGSEDFYWAKHRCKHERVREVIYGRYADGYSSARCLRRLGELVAPMQKTC